MARGPKKHLKRLNAPKHWMLDKMGGVWAPRPSTGPHKLRECLPLTLVLRNRLKYALTRQETMMIVMRRLIQVDHKVRTDLNYPAGFQDVITIPKSDENFRLLYDAKGRFTLHRISDAESGFKLLKVRQLAKGSKASTGRNPIQAAISGKAAMAAIPYIVTHDGRTIRYPDPSVKVGDTVKFDIKSGKLLGSVKFEVGNIAMITGGANKGRVGVIAHREAHPGSFEIIHIKDRKGHEFSTRESNVFVIGEGNKSWISLPRQKGIRMTIIEEREKALSKK
jgi:small subunit ribosomal protein S4e